MVEIYAPEVGESVTEATVAKWYKKVGEEVREDDVLCALETDKVTIEVPAQVGGVLEKIVVEAGGTVMVKGVLGHIKEGARARVSQEKKGQRREEKEEKEEKEGKEALVMESVLVLAQEKGVDISSISGTGKGGRILRADVLAVAGESVKAAVSAAVSVPVDTPIFSSEMRPLKEGERAEPMTKLRKTVAKRLKEAQHKSAILTTFNEVDLSSLKEVRQKYREAFEKRHGVRLGFMSFFVKAATVALQRVPLVNAEISGESIILKDFCHIGVAVSTPAGLMVPVLKHAEKLSLAGIEASIANFAKKGRDGNISIEDLSGGSFTISNGGIFGSLLSTPILNPPQSAILGMHRIEERAVVVKGEVVVRPMMYLALSYDHRLVDGREAVTFLVIIKQCLEEIERLILDL